MAVSVSKMLTKVFGSRNERLLKRFTRMVSQINQMESKVQQLTDEQLRARAQELRKSLHDKTIQSSEVYPEAFAIIRESMDRNIGIRQIFNPEPESNIKFDPSKLEPNVRAMYDAITQQLIATGESWRTVPIPVEFYAAVRKLYPESRPPFRARCFDVQLIGGLVLYEGKIAEMATGEGKTFVAPLACFMKVLEGNHCHVVTVNDYLVKRDASWVKPAFEALGMSVGYIQSDMEPGGEARRRQYDCDITYGTNSEFGFDYLRDNMKERVDLQVQGPLDFSIVDEVDSILIDEARTPLIISGAAHDDAPKYRAADDVARKIMDLNRPWDAVEREVEAAKRLIKASEGDLEKAKSKEEKESARQRREKGEKDLAEAEKKKEGLTQYYEVEWDKKSVHLSHQGIAAAQEIAGVGSFYVGSNMEWPHLMEQAMRAHVVYEKDKEYVVERGQRGDMEVIIVDEFTGRKMVGRQWSDGLHQAVEAKERVTIKQETQTLATITLQNFFKLYKSLSGMTGTAQTEAEEFQNIYRLEVVTIPTNRPIIRQDNEDRVYRKEGEKWAAIIDEIKAYSDAGRPVLVGTTSVEKSEMLSNLLKRKYGIDHEVLNAKYHEREAHIVALAGQTHPNSHGELVGNVTIATNMAGRGTDIKPSPETFFDIVDTPANGTGGKYVLKQRGTDKTIEVDTTDEQSMLPQVFQLGGKSNKAVGGLHVIGTERHTARRIDNQLRGRSGRQGDSGSSRFYVSLEDELMKMFAGEWVIRVLGWLGMEEGVPIEDKRITKGILKAQRKVEERNFLSRKNLLDYDEVMDHQRTVFYGMRQQVLEGRDVDQVIWGMIGDAIRDAVDKYITKDYIAANISEWVRTNFEVNIDPVDLKGQRDLGQIEDFVKDQARAEAETNISATLGEFMGDNDADPSTWDAKGLSSWAMSRFRVNLPQNQIRKMGSKELEEKLRAAAVEQINQRDVTPLEKYLQPLYAEGELAAWAKEKFSIELNPHEMLVPTGRDSDRKLPDEIVSLIEQRARESYAAREVEYPIDYILAILFGGNETGVIDNPYAADNIRKWAWVKYGVEIPMDRLRGMNIRLLRDELIGYQEKFLRDGQLKTEMDAMAKQNPEPQAMLDAFNKRFASQLTLDAIKEHNEIMAERAAKDSSTFEPEPLPEFLYHRAREFLRQELTQLEQFVLIQIFDQTWKDHLYAMDMLKGSVGLAGFAEQDPRIVYKKEGYEYFRLMMQGVRDKVTDLIFRARITSAAPQRSAYRETAAVHQETESYGVAENAQAIAAAGGEAQVASEQPQGEGAATRTIVRETEKVGRNDPCPCGSGKKYKKCCGATVV